MAPSTWITVASIPGMMESHLELWAWAVQVMPFLRRTVVPASDGPNENGRVSNRLMSIVLQ